jgi:hypothetical protein
VETATDEAQPKSTDGARSDCLGVVTGANNRGGAARTRRAQRQLNWPATPIAKRAFEAHNALPPQPGIPLPKAKQRARKTHSPPIDQMHQQSKFDLKKISPAADKLIFVTPRQPLAFEMLSFTAALLVIGTCECVFSSGGPLLRRCSGPTTMQPDRPDECQESYRPPDAKASRFHAKPECRDFVVERKRPQRSARACRRVGRQAFVPSSVSSDSVRKIFVDCREFQATTFLAHRQRSPAESLGNFLVRIRPNPKQDQLKFAPRFIAAISVRFDAERLPPPTRYDCRTLQCFTNGRIAQIAETIFHFAHRKAGLIQYELEVGGTV